MIKNVKMLIGAHAYACIEMERGGKIDIRLEPGKSAAKSLLAYADDQRARAGKLLELAEIAESAAFMLPGKRYES